MYLKSRPKQPTDEGVQRSAYIAQQIEYGKMAAEASKREKLEPARAAKELYISPVASVGTRQILPAESPPALPPLNHSSSGARLSAGSKRAAGDLMEQNRALRQRVEEYRVHSEGLAQQLMAREREVHDMRERVSRAEVVEQQLRSDLKHQAHRNEVLENINSSLQKDREDNGSPALWASRVPDAPSDGPGDGEDKAAPEPAPLHHTHTFLHLVERGLTRQLERASASEPGAPDSAGRRSAGADEGAESPLKRHSLETQLRQLTAMQTEMQRLKEYADTMQQMTARLQRQVKAKDKEYADLAQRLHDGQAEADTTLVALNDQLAEVRRFRVHACG